MSYFLRRKLQSWVKAGLISAEQATAIEGHEARPKGAGWGLWGVGMIGAYSIGMGLISIIAANWDAIPATAKLAVYYALTAALALWHDRCADRRDWLRPTTALLFMLALLGGIGLIAQIYHLSSNGWSGLLLWSFLAIAAAVRGDAWATAVLWWGIFLVALGVMVGTAHVGTWLSGEASRMIAADTLAFALLFATLPGLWHEGMIARFARRGAMILGFCIVVALVGVASFLWYKSAPFGDTSSAASLASQVMVLGLGARSYAMMKKKLPAWPVDSFHVALGLAWLYVTFSVIWGHQDAKLAGCLGFLVVWAAVAVFAARLRHKPLFDLATFIIIARLYGVYVELFGGLLMTGVGMMLSGVLLIACTSAWRKYRARVLARLGVAS